MPSIRHCFVGIIVLALVGGYFNPELQDGALMLALFLSTGIGVSYFMERL